MATAIYTVRVTNYVDGGWFEFEMEQDVFDDDVEDYDPQEESNNLYNEVMNNLEIDWDFVRWEDLPEVDDNA